MAETKPEAEVKPVKPLVRSAAETKPEAAQPATGPGRFRVSLGEDSAVFEARDENEAWALYCDSRQSWPSPRLRTVERI